jgi:hypothetical protein
MDPREPRTRTAVLERPIGVPGPAPANTKSNEQLRRSQGIRDLIGGAALISIGFLFGSSVFTGDPTLLDWLFDGLGTFWVAKGLYLLITANSTGSV